MARGRCVFQESYQGAFKIIIHQNPAAFESSGAILYVPITLHLVGDDEGEGYFPIQDALDQLCRLNDYFEQAQIHFFPKGAPQYLNNSEWRQGNQHSSMANYNIDSTINCYIIQKGPNYSGYAAIVGNAVVLTRRGFTAWPPLFAHEIGHALSLYPTFLGWEGYNGDFSTPAPEYIGGHKVERVDGLDCNIAGDGFCDTPPDYLSSVNSGYSCNFNGESLIFQTGPNGATFRSDCSLIMSYAPNSSRFSDMQISAMRANLEQERPYLLYGQGPLPDIPETQVALISPA